MRNLLPAFFAAAFISAVNTSSAIATPVIDQDFLQPTYESYSPAAHIQSWLGINFTVGITGKLTQVDLALFQEPGATLDQFNVNLTSLVGGLPGSVLDSANFSTAALPAPFPVAGQPVIPFVVTFLDGGIDVVAGQELAITLTRTTGGTTVLYWILWNVNNAPTDPDFFFSRDSGATWRVAGPIPPFGQTLGFRTYVDAVAVPEPATLALFAAGLAGAGVMRRRRSRGVDIGQ